MAQIPASRKLLRHFVGSSCVGDFYPARERAGITPMEKQVALPRFISRWRVLMGNYIGKLCLCRECGFAGPANKTDHIDQIHEMDPDKIQGQA